MIKIAILDLYNNEVNQGMRCIQDIILEASAKFPSSSFHTDIFDFRYKNESPNDDYNIYISSGGPGSPFEGEGTDWEKKYFSVIESVWSNNQNSDKKKYLFFICHSFQLMARFFKFGIVSRRYIKSFGVKPVYKTENGNNERVFNELPNPFYAADFRDWQVTEPNNKVLDELDAKILALEEPDDNLLERAMMAVRISEEIIGTQFHPEADPASMHYHFKQPERKEQVVSQYGEEKYESMIKLLEDENSIPLTRKTVLPSFLQNSIRHVIEQHL